MSEINEKSKLPLSLVISLLIGVGWLSYMTANTHSDVQNISKQVERILAWQDRHETSQVVATK